MNSPSLRELYQRTSKHSQYQVLPSGLAELLGSEALDVQSRHEQARLAWMMSRVQVAGKRTADIGGNTGFFSFELLAHAAASVDYHEGNAAHHEFVVAAARALGLSERLRAHAGYVNFMAGELARVDVLFLLNVLHHLGDDFGAQSLALEAARQQMLDCLASVSRSCTQLVFQMGFNWKGDPRHPLFPNGTKAEMIDFVRKGTEADWDVEAIGIAEGSRDKPVFRDLSEANLARRDDLGEFLNRPIFVLRSHHLSA